MNINRTSLLLFFALIVASCVNYQNTPINEDNSINSNMGELFISEIQLVNEVHDVVVSNEEIILLVFLEGPDHKKLLPEVFSLEEFQKMLHDENYGDVYVQADDGNIYYNTLAGWISSKSDSFCMGFIVNKKSTTYQLFWPGNGPIVLIPNI